MSESPPVSSALRPRYSSLWRMASGGMGAVELSLRQEGRFTRVVAMKRLHEHLADDAEMREMFLDEARLTALIRHVNVVSVLDVGVDEIGPYFVMEYIEGTSLAALLSHLGERLLPVQLCVRIAQQIAEGLHAAHELCDEAGAPLHLVHRDVSPQNVLLGSDGAVKVVDFGVAKVLGAAKQTGLGVLKGKLGYMAPEQLRMQPVDRRTDLFALGVVLCELLLGRRLYHGNSSQVASSVLQDPPPDIGDERPEIPPALVELSFELLAKEREARPRSAREVAKRLEEVLAECIAEEGLLDLSELLQQELAPQLRATRERLQQALTRRVAAEDADAPGSETPADMATAPTQLGPLAALSPIKLQNVSYSYYSSPAAAGELGSARRRRVAVLLALAAALVGGWALWSAQRAAPTALATAREAPTALATANEAPAPLAPVREAPAAREAPAPVATANEAPAPLAQGKAARKTPRKAARKTPTVPVWQW